MITSPTVSVLRNNTNPAWESGSSGEKGAVNISQLSVHDCVSLADPSRQASRLPIKVLKMLTARAGHILHPEYLQPLPSTPVSPIEVSTTVIFEKTFLLTDKHLLLSKTHWTSITWYHWVTIVDKSGSVLYVNRNSFRVSFWNEECFYLH